MTPFQGQKKTKIVNAQKGKQNNPDHHHQRTRIGGRRSEVATG